MNMTMGMPYTPKFQEYPAGFIPIGRGDTPDKLYLRTRCAFG